MIRFNIWALFLVLLFLSMGSSPAIAAKPILKHAIGDTISAEEADRYGLFSDQFGFQQAVIVEASVRSAKLLIVTTFDGIESLQQEIRVNNSVLEVLPAVLAHQDSLLSGLEVSRGIPARVEPEEGVNVTGFITAWTGTELIVETQFGVSTIPLDQISDLEASDYKLVIDDVIWFRDPNRTRLFFMPTGRSLKAGEGYFAVYEVLFPSLQVGVGHNISVGGGMFPFSGGGFFLGWLTGQVGIIDREEFSLAVGTLATFISEEETSNAGIYYGVGSYGSSQASVSMALGVGFEDGTNLADEPLVVIGGELRTGRTTKLITENWIIPGVDTPVVSLGFRWFGEHLAADFALVRPIGEDIYFIGIPWVDFVVHF